MPNRLFPAIALGVLSAVLFSSVVLFPGAGLITGYLSPLVLMGLGLVKGVAAVVIAGSAGVVVLAVAGPIAFAPAYLASDVLPSLLVVTLALRGQREPVGAVLSWLVVAGLGIVLALAAVTSGPDGLEASVAGKLAEVLAQVAPQMPEMTRLQAAEAWAKVLPGGVAASWVLRAVLCGVLAQWLVTRMGRALRPTPAYVATVLPQWLLVVLGGLLFLGWIMPGDSGYLARNMAVVAAFPFLLQGLTVIHSAVRLTQNPRPWLVAFYVMFFFSSGLAVLVMIGLGLVENVLRLRPRISDKQRGKTRSHQEDE